jgi:hypothetical protein
MNRGIRFFREASHEIEHERAWYREQSPRAETMFLRELDRAVEAITEAPERWPNHLSGTRRYVLRTFPFSLVYLVEESVVLIVALAGERRRPGYWQKRLRAAGEERAE